MKTMSFYRLKISVCQLLTLNVTTTAPTPSQNNNMILRFKKGQFFAQLILFALITIFIKKKCHYMFILIFALALILHLFI